MNLDPKVLIAALATAAGAAIGIGSLLLRRRRPKAPDASLADEACPAPVLDSPADLESAMSNARATMRRIDASGRAREQEPERRRTA